VDLPQVWYSFVMRPERGDGAYRTGLPSGEMVSVSVAPGSEKVTVNSGDREGRPAGANVKESAVVATDTPKRSERYATLAIVSTAFAPRAQAVTHTLAVDPGVTCTTAAHLRSFAAARARITWPVTCARAPSTAWRAAAPRTRGNATAARTAATAMASMSSMIVKPARNAARHEQRPVT
jgi:hypothetical protein